MAVIRATSTTRWDDYREEDIDVVALRFRYDPTVKDAVKKALGIVRDETSNFAGTWDNEQKFWWCFPWAWEAMAEILTAVGITYDDSEVDDLFAPPASERKRRPQQEVPKATPKQPHEVLGVALTASDIEIKSAHRELSKQWHPDRIPLDVAPELRDIATKRMAEINAAYDILKSRFRRPA